MKDIASNIYIRITATKNLNSKKDYKTFKQCHSRSCDKHSILIP